MQNVRRGMVLGLVILAVAVAVPLAVRWALSPKGPAIEVTLPSGAARTVTLAALRRFPVLTRQGEYQNQFGNWRDAGTYSGVRLTELLGGIDYEAVDVVAQDGYRVTIDRSRIEVRTIPSSSPSRRMESLCPHGKTASASPSFPRTAGSRTKTTTQSRPAATGSRTSLV